MVSFNDVGIAVKIKEGDFLKIVETLTRIGIFSRKKNSLYQTIHILHKRGEYRLLHFKELFLLDGKSADISEIDIKRRNVIAALLYDWGLVEIKSQEVLDNETFSMLKYNLESYELTILPFSKKHSTNLVPKYTVGKKNVRK